jgi:site-specific recombinase XerD
MGLRVSEALTITHDDVFLLDGTLNLHIVGKGSRERRIPMSSKAAGFILPGITPQSVQLRDSAARQLFIVESNKAGIGKHPSHDFRATAATAFYYASGKDLRATQLFLGHANSSTTEVYVQPARERLLAGVNF